MQKLSRWAVAALALMLALTTFAALPAIAQEGGATFGSDVVANLDGVGKKMIALAEATPENMFGWRTTKDVRTVSEVYMHTVGTNLLLLPLLGAPMAEGVEVLEGGNAMGLARQWEADVTTKAEVIEWLKKSYAYAQENIPKIEDLDGEVQLFGRTFTRRAVILIILSHAHEHLGQSIAYTRSMGLVPPWSQPQN